MAGICISSAMKRGPKLVGHEGAYQKTWLLMMLTALLTAFSFQGARGLYETSEGRYAECAREMRETGNYLEPTLDYKPHWTKPPLTYWAMVAGMRLLGANAWGTRLANAFAFLFTVLAVALMGSILWGQQTGLIAGFTYASSPFPIFGAFAATADTLLTLWETGAVLCYVRAFRNARPVKQKTWILGMWLFFGLGFLTKGPPALLPLLAILLWHFLKKPPVRFAFFGGVSLFLLVGFSWYLLVSYRHPELIHIFLGQEVVDRITSSKVHNPEWYKPFTMYLPVLILGAVPWIYFGLKILHRLRVFNPGVFWQYLQASPTGSFLMVWFFLPLIIFFASKSHLYLYVLPLYAPMALVMARAMASGITGPNIVGRVLKIGLVTCCVMIAVKGLATYFPTRNNMKALYDFCIQEAGEKTDFIVFRRPKLYGLQFYLHGRLKHLSESGEESWVDGTVKDYLRDFRKSVTAKRATFITDKGHADNLTVILQAEQVPFRMVEGEFWTLFLI